MDFRVIKELHKRVTEASMLREFLESFAGGAGKALGMGVVIALALWLIQVLEISIPKIP